jgi:hypothetical protein
MFLAGNAVAAGDGAVLGGGVESDTEDGLNLVLIGGYGFTDKTWLTGGLARSSVKLGTGRDLDNLYADLELDHWFGPLGVRVGGAYWGNSDILESQDGRFSLYWRGESAMFAAEFERRNFDLTIPGTDFSPGRRITFDADGLGATLRFDLGDRTDVRLTGMAYDYSVPFRPIEDRDVIDLISVSRLSVLNSLVDHRAGITLGIDRGTKRWEFDAATSEGAIAAVRRNSYTLRYLLPMTDSSDIEFSLGYDESDVFGDVTFFSVYLYLYDAD